MTTTINIEWAQPDEREDEREDSCWYTYWSGHDLVAYVMKGERTVTIHADGEMRIEAYKKVGEEYVYEGVIRYSDDLEEFGITKDSDLWGLDHVPDTDLDMRGPNRNGYYYVIDNNSWFDLYTEEGEHLDCVCDVLTDAIESATYIVNDDEDELWNEPRKDKDSDV